MSNLTIKDIAKMAGVSPTVVSFVINGREGVSAKTRKKVEELIASTHFTPSRSSRRLVLNKSFNISVIMKSTSNPFLDFFYFEITRGILEKSKEYGYNIVFTDMSDDSEASVPDILAQGDADGVIFYQQVDEALAAVVAEKKIPAVLIDSDSQDIAFPYINANYYTAAYTATKYLIEKGHREIAMIASSFAPAFYNQIFTGFSKALSENSLMLSPEWLCINATNEQDAYNAMQRLLEAPRRPTAVFCATDMFAIGAMKCAKSHKLSIPRDLSVIGIDDIVISEYVEPALTTIRIDKKEMGVRAMELIMDKINGKEAENLVLPSDQIVERGSVADIR